MNTKPLTIDYLVGGLRISVGPGSTTPGPRNHILNFVEALRRSGHNTRLFLASDVPGLRRFARLPEGSGGAQSTAVILVSDLVRLAAMFWSGAALLAGRVTSSAPDVIYERLSVMQSLTSFHPAKRKSFRIVESNGIMSRETARDRKALVLERVAAAIERRAYRRADLVVAVSQALASEISRFAGISTNKIAVIPNAVPISLQDATRTLNDSTSRALSMRAARPIVGFAGSVVDWQQLDMLLRAYAESGLSDLAIEIIGDGPALDSLREQAQEGGIADRVTFFGRLPQDDVYSTMRRWTAGFAGHKSTSSDDMYHSPLKLYEYAGVGIGVLCTRSDDAIALRESGLPMWEFSNESGLRQALIEVRDCGLPEDFHLDGHKQVLSEHSWPSRVEKVLQASAGIGLAR